MEANLYRDGAADGPAPLTAAAFFEGEFTLDWLMELTGLRPTALLGHLEEGVEQGWLEGRGHGRYVFPSLEKKRGFKDELSEEESSSLHRRIAELILKEYPEGAEKAKAVAHHLLHVTNDEERCRWLLKAGDDYVKDFRTDLAQGCYLKVIQDLGRTSSGIADDLFIRAALNYSKASATSLDVNRVDQMLTEALTRARQGKKVAALALLEMHLAKNEWLRNRYGQAFMHFQAGWSLANEAGDPKLLRSAMIFSTFFLYWQGRFREVISHYEKSVPDVDRHPQGSFPLLAHITVSHCYGMTAQVSQGLGMVDAIRSHCLEKGDKSLAAFAGGTMALIMLDARRMNEALDCFHVSTKVAREVRNTWLEILGLATLAFAYYLNDEPRKAISSLRKYLRLSRRSNVSIRHLSYLMDVLWAVETGRLPAVAGFSLEKEIKRTLAGHNIFMKGVASRYRALMEERAGRPMETVLDSLGQSVKWLEESGHQIELARSRLEMGRVFLDHGLTERAREMTNSASNLFLILNREMAPADLRALMTEPPSREQQLKEILKLGQEMVTIRDNKDLVQHIISTVNRITGAERGAIFLLSESSGPSSLRLRASKNLTFDQVNHPGFRSSMEMIERAARTGQPFIACGPAADVSAHSDRQVIRSRLGVPMILRDQVVGVLYHDNRLLSSAFRESDLELLAYVAGQAALALDNATAYEEIQRLNEKLQEENRYYEEQQYQSSRFENIIGESAVMIRLLAQVEQVATTDTTVLVLGETGVGKELVATAIHRLSPRNQKPFIKTNCSALTDTLLTSELFGHEKGAFTGAAGRRIGRFELAHGGTIFLDEIGDLPMEAQVRLLRVLQSGEFERVGGTETLYSDFRLIAATNLDLEQAVREQRFRADLFYRLNVFPILVPPLRERREDIALLAHHFLMIYGQRTGKNFKRIPDEEMKKLLAYRWPGNVRELENVMERAAILSPPHSFRLPDLIPPGSRESDGSNGVTLKENERRHIIWALQKTGWKVRGEGGAAEILEVHPSTLAFRMKKLGIQRPPRRRGKRGP
ncbi:MAG: sigma 54-interacting transcriptional regulator [Thermodesulfobacteriota bacterium]